MTKYIASADSPTSYPLLLASWLKFRDNPDGLERILKLIEAFTFRGYIVVGYRGDTARTYLYRRARYAYQETWDCDRIIAEMENLHERYIGDETFADYLRADNFFRRLSSYQIRYLLSEYEIELNPDAGVDWQRKMLSSTYEVEHIWPGNTNKLNLSEQEAEEHSRDFHKLGNLTVVSQADNTRLTNDPFRKKKKIFGDEESGTPPPHPNRFAEIPRQMERHRHQTTRRRDSRLRPQTLERGRRITPRPPEPPARKRLCDCPLSLLTPKLLIPSHPLDLAPAICYPFPRIHNP